MLSYWNKGGTTVKIDHSIKTGAIAPVGENPPRAGKIGGRPAQGQEAGSVRLSPPSSQLQAIETSLANSQVVNTARVEEIKQAIAEGHFKVNPEAVADRLIETVKEMLRSHKA